MSEGKNSSRKLAELICLLFYTIFWITFVYTSYRIYQFALDVHPHVWIVCNILNGIAGGIFLVYPFTALKNSVAEMLYHWICYFRFRCKKYLLRI